MRINRKGDIGFMEAMAGTMIVCIVLLAFTSFFYTEITLQHGEKQEFDWSCIGDITIEDGTASVNETYDLHAYLDNKKISGLSIKICSSGTFDFNPYFQQYGKTSDEHLTEKMIKPASNSDGCSFPVLVEVTLFV